ncbi:MAG: chitobiase/beta-hexosaminidase C-terminal domain-containing protein [Bacteroidaceae bacterium]|nr:chitobiase/beta-hexosaminidase C-terminal domain-containing protein [Bacteroidaceae bacterium]
MTHDMSHDMTYMIENLRHGRRFFAERLSLRTFLLVMMLLTGAVGAMAQNYYVFYNSSNGYIVNNNGNLGVNSTFTPSAVWIASGQLGSTSRSLRSYTDNTLYLIDNDNAVPSLSTSSGTDRWRIDNSNYLYARWNRNYYIKYSNSSFNTNDQNTNGNVFTAYSVTITDVTSTSTNPTISGVDLLTATGNSTYTATGAAYRVGYTNYRFNNADHYYDANGNSFTGTPANATIGTYTWTLTDNSYATINSSGVVNVSSLPESDITLTLTATATATGGNPVAPSGITLTGTKEITIQGTKPSAPIITINGTSVTMSTDAAGSTTIRYTLDGTEPTASTGTVYSGPIDLSGSADSPITIKAVTVRDGNASAVTTETVTLTLPEPVITVNASAGTASISATTGATIYYTTDGSDPTTSSTQYSGSLSSLAAMTTIKAIAVKTGWNDSPVASATVTIPSGVSGGTVTLFDYEDHNWTYYSGVDASVDGGNYNTNYVGKLYSPNPRNVKITYNGVNGISGSSTTVRVSISESETSFVYYKTLEQGSTSGEYPYQVISNPFSVRPSTGSGNSKTYYGFAGWKIVSGGEYIKNHNNNDVLSLDEQIVFNNLPYPSVNCTSAEIVFETTWTQANVRTGNDISTMLGNFSGGTYETNFAVLTGNYTTAWTGNKNATITSVLPDGSTDYRGAYTRLNVTVSNGYTIKYEYININNYNSTLSMGTGTKTLYIGRGVSNTTANGVCCNVIQGYSDAIGNNGGLTYTLKIESGVYNYLSYIKGYDGNQVDERVQGTVSVKGVLGCDYDRAKNDNTKLKIQEQIFMGYANNSALLRSTTAGQEVLNVTLKSGSLNSNLTSAGTADAEQSFYIGIAGQYSPGYRIFTMEGGEMWSLAAGLCQNTATTNSVRFRIKGGLIKGSIYGSAANANSYGYKQMILTGGQVKGWIAGGGNGTSANGGTTTGSSYVYVGGNCRVDSEGSNTKINSSLGGQVFGSGSGVENTTTWGEMMYGTNVVLADNAYIERNAFGGGNFGWTDEYANIYLTGGNMSVGKVFGGANQNKGDNVRIYMTGGTVREGLYGGSNTTGTINYNVEMHINGGQVGTPSSPANIHGGGYGQPTRVSQNVDITLGTQGQTTPGVTVNGDVYGGSALGYVNGSTADDTYHTYVTLNKGIINGSLYGGGLGDGSTAANVYGPVQVKVYGGSVRKTDSNGANGSGGVYGANNVNGAPQRSVTVDIYGTDPAPSANEYALFAVYGGGNAADYTYGNGYPTVTVHNCDNSIEYVYGGGNAAAVAATDVTIYGGNVIGNVFGGGNGTVTAANVTGNTLTKIYGGTIGRVFGGSNSQGTIGGTITVNALSQAESSGTACPMLVDELYGGGNRAASNVGSISIGCMGDNDMINYVYGGANQADITGNINLLMSGGRVGNLFGGNNTSGNISGSITVTVNWDGSCNNNYLGNVFGGGNLATFGTTGSPKAPTVNILNGTVSGNVYGGGKGNLVDGTQRGVAGKVTGNPAVNIGDNVSGHTAIVVGDVYGGGDAADVAGTPVIVVNDCNTEIGYLYGGGNAADVNGTNITVNGGTIHHDAFGGGHGDKDASNPSKYADVKGNVVFNVYGGTFGRVFAGSNSKGDITGTSALTINKTGTCEMHISEVYGGGNQAAGNAGTITIGCTGSSTEGIVDVYGGANAADINNDITLTITGGNIARVFGGNNSSGAISGDIQVNINWDDPSSCGYNYLGSVFGGGNLAAYSGTPDVNIQNGTVSGSVYGGGNEAGVGGGDVAMTGGSVLGGIYGGCNTSGTVDGDITVEVTGGTVGTSSAHANIFGGGYGYQTATTGNVTVNIGTISAGVTSGNAVIYGDVYGGSALGNVNADTNNSTLVNLNKGTIHGDAYGGGLGNDTYAALVNGNVTVTQNGVAFVTATTTDDNSNTVVTAGRIFGCNNLNGSPQGTVLVLVNKTARSDGGAHTKSVYDANGNITTNNYEMNAVDGGGNLAAYNPAAATLTTTGQFTSYDGIDGNGDPTTHTHVAANKPLQVIVNGCNNVSIEYVYGGGNAAPTPSTDVVVLGAFEIGYTFGGGNGKDRYTVDGGVHWNTNPGADVGVMNSTNYGSGDANSAIYGGTIHEVYGASNQKGTIVGNINLDVREGIVSCPLVTDKIVGAGKNADVESDIIMVMGCMPETKTALVFGGADNANVNGNVELTITSGTFGKVFGGNNLGGIIKGHLKLNIEETGCSPIKIDELYLGGNEAAYSRFGYYDTGTTDSYGRPIYAPRESASDTHTAVTNPANDASHTFPYAQPVLNVISCTYIGKVFGGGLGEGAAMYADPTVNINMIPGDFANDATKGVPAVMTTRSINPNDNPNNLGVLVDVYGGGNEAAVYGSTTVNVGTTIGQSVTLTSTNTSTNVIGAFVSGTVYGAGKGVATDPDAAIVKGNTRVNMAGGHVSRSIYGGGELSSVGTFTETYTTEEKHPYHAVGEPKTCAANTGLTEVIVSGGQVGLVNQLMPDPSRPTSDDDYGYIFCAGKGVADSTATTGYTKAHLLAVCGSTHLEISGGLITASVYGGSENGQVLGNTHVEIKGGQIGTGYHKENGVDTWDAAYTDAQWTAAINAIKSGDVSTLNTTIAPQFHECDAWPFGTEGNRHVYDYFAGTSGYDAKGGASPGSDGHSFYGHVFGGGSGYYPYAAGQWRRTAGRVCGNTLVEITGGHILTNVYGGNEITDVLGHSKVEMTGGTVGVPRTVTGIQSRPVNSYIFGAGMGDPRTLFNGWSNVGSSEVIVHGNAVVFGSVFGGGEDGHVLGNSSTTIKGNALIGTFGTSGVDGNIFGSGRGFSAIALTAGVICGNITVNISENAQILGSVYGGGRLAAVGTYLAAENDTNYGKLQPGDSHGNVTINITGGTIGTQAGVGNHAYSVGDVFGGSKGALMSEWAKSQKLGLVKNTTVNISQASDTYPTTIYGNVYGGGEIASVGSYTYATASDATTYNTTHPQEPMTEGDVKALDEANTGKATISITGGTIGQNSLSDTHGLVFGGCLGKAGTGYSGYSFVNNSDVTLNGGTVYGCVFGGGENGHVLHNTDVKIKSGTVGIRLDNVADGNLVDNMIYRGNVYGGGRGIDQTTSGDYSITAGKVSGNTNVTVEGGTVYRCVYGGGSLASVGNRDEDDTDDGLATVTIKGGTIGTDGGAAANDYSSTVIPVREARRENGYVYGSGRGMSAGHNSSSTLLHLAYTKNTIVSIEGTANVTGSVFGGGENGHVKKNTKVYIKENCLVGTELNAAEHEIDDNGRGRLIYRANVYGGGRGIDTNNSNYSVTAGRVYGNTFVEVSGGKIYHDVFGGGSLASVGNETINPTTGEVTYGDESGQTKVVIKGGIVGYSSTAKYQGFNCGFVYGGCRGLAAAPSSDLVKMAYVHKTEVDIETGADIKGSVFGGSANGHVKNDTYVKITGGSIGTALFDDDPATTDVDESEARFDDYGVAVKLIFRGNVYAGGRGVDQYNLSSSPTYSMTAGAVYGNAKLEMTGGHVWHNVYGSGAMASVGTVEAKPTGMHVHDEVVNGSGVVQNPDADVNYLSGVFKTGTGKVEVIITGGTVGDTTPGHEGLNNGGVYGAGRGVSAQRSDYVARMEYVNETFVTIGTSGQLPSSYSGSTPDALNYPYIYGAVFGGGENGHVKKDTDVKIYSGIIGWPLVQGTSQDAQRYKEAADGSAKNPYRGHVFGAGCGVDPAHHGTGQERSSTAGRVYGHTNVTMTGGVVRRAIYGGGLLASVGVYKLNSDDGYHITDIFEDNENPNVAGKATITISGGYIGNVNTDGTALSGTDATGIAYLAPGDNNGHVFGSSCGMVADNYEVGGQQVDVQYRQMGYTHSTHVNISGNDTHIFGCVFGSGENGHVWENAIINISGGTIGSEGNTSKFVGNVYGSGRGVDHPHSPTGISETAGKVRGNTTVNLTGGIVWRDVYGGGSLASVGEADEAANDSKKNITSDPTTNNPFPYSTGLTRVVIDGTSAVHGSVYGSGRGVASTSAVYKQAAYVKNTLVTVKGTAHVYQNVFGGGNAGHVRRNTDVTIDGSAKVDNNVYGGGAGDISSPTAGLVNHDVAVNIKGGLIGKDVYGGGAIANTNVHDKRNTGTYGKPSEDQYAKTEVNLTGGIILGDAYGGGQGVIPGSGATAEEIANAAALVRGDVTVTLNGTAFGLSTTKDDQNNDIASSGRVFGCNNLNGTPQGTVLVHVLKTLGVTTSGTAPNLTYAVNNTKPTKKTDTYEVEAVYGGGNLAAYEPWDPLADGQFTSYSRTISGTPTAVAHDATDKPLQVVVDGCDLASIRYVYGGGNAAPAPATDVLIIGSYEIGNVFGGGNGKDRINKNGWAANPGADVGYKADGTTTYGTGKALASVVGGTVYNIFGGSNTKGNVRSTAEVFLDKASDCPLVIGEAYGGGNEAYMDGGSVISLGCIDYLDVIYGGAKNADVNGNIEMTITSGHFNRVFGGNNLGGTISGSIEVNIEETGCNPITIGELYGCGNMAPYGDSSNPKIPTINIKSFTSIGRVFGGGFGFGATVTGDPTIYIDEVVGEHATNTAWDYHQETVAGKLVGKTIEYHDDPNNPSTVTSSVTMPTHASGAIGAIGTVFGGGNAAEVDGNTNVYVGTKETISYVSGADHADKNVVGVDIRGNVFGGGNKAAVTGNTNVVVGR